MLSLQELLKKLEKQISFLSYKYFVPGYSQNDLKQELILKITEDYRSGFNNKENLGWWFFRLKWHVYNMIKKATKEPLNNSISLNFFD